MNSVNPYAPGITRSTTSSKQPSLRNLYANPGNYGSAFGAYSTFSPKKVNTGYFDNLEMIGNTGSPDAERKLFNNATTPMLNFFNQKSQDKMVPSQTLQGKEQLLALKQIGSGTSITSFKDIMATPNVFNAMYHNGELSKVNSRQGSMRNLLSLNANYYRHCENNQFDSASPFIANQGLSREGYDMNYSG
mmetsp:Transcript_39026/g.37339  ORF Transcript_39026/g.37339 Transcript_39026/m.37339 type:complete len:190 (+) Transcript_39026:1699-2268(+)